jgi:hypothetical protein
MMVRLFVLFPSLALTPHRDRCPIIAVNDACDAEKSEPVDLLFLFFEFGHLAYFLGGRNLCRAAERIGACPRWTSFSTSIPILARRFLLKP